MGRPCVAGIVRVRRYATRALLGAALLVAASRSPRAASASAPAAACGPHQHLVVEKDEEEGATTRRCLCDAGWDADGPAPPCRAVAPARPARKRPAKHGG